MVSTQDLVKKDVLAALYNSAKPQGMGFLHYDAAPMSPDEAQHILDEGHTYFDYVKGRVMKVDLKNDSGFEEFLYDRDNGSGAADSVINRLRASQQENA
jgi:hypothetical protein